MDRRPVFIRKHPRFLIERLLVGERLRRPTMLVVFFLLLFPLAVTPGGIVKRSHRGLANGARPRLFSDRLSGAFH
jgi:hypothetical protein